MHPIPFSLKRAHHCSLAKQRKWLAQFGITPARYDLLVVIADTNRWLKKVHFVHQSDLWRALGVTPAVVCKMLGALEKLKLVRRARSKAADRRQVNVELTRKARGLLNRVQKFVIRPGLIWFALYTAFGTRNADVRTFNSLLETFRKSFEDNATFLYPWCRRTTHPKRTVAPSPVT